jgi:GTPase Era involved in 16S rRNA processing
MAHAGMPSSYRTAHRPRHGTLTVTQSDQTLTGKDAGVPVMRIVIIGRTGKGKSATVNSILGRKDAFVSKRSSNSITKCYKFEEAIRFGRRIQIVDTPGFFDNELSSKDTAIEVSKCIGIASPGPHAFLLVKKPDRYTQEEQDTVRLFREQFGEDMMKYLIVVITCKDDLDYDGPSALEEYVRRDPRLNQLLSECGHRYMAINNRQPQETEHRQLIDMIDEMVRQNGGSYYTSAKLEQVEEQLKKREEDILKQRNDERQKQMEKWAAEREHIRTEARIKAEAEARAEAKIVREKAEKDIALLKKEL